MNDVHTTTVAGPRRRGAPPADRRLTRDAVLVRAEQVLERDGSRGFSLRALARDLDVAPGALYNHVQGRDDLLDAVAARFLDTWRSDGAPGTDWAGWVRSVAVELHERMLHRPVLAELVLDRGRSAAGLGLLGRFRERLAEAGVGPAFAHLTWHAVLVTVLGAVQQERARPDDRGETFALVLDVVLDGLAARAGDGPDERAEALLAAHPHARPADGEDHE